MRRIIQVFSLCIFLFCGLLPAFTQENVVLEYYNNPDGFNITQTRNSGFETTKYAGMNLLPGDKIISNTSRLELQFEQSGSTVLLREFSTLEYGASDTARESAGNLNMTRGTMRIKAESSSNFNITSTNTTVRFAAGDYILDYSNPDAEQWHVLKGQLEVITRRSGVAAQIPEKNSGKFSPVGAVTITPLGSKEITALEDEYKFTWFSQLTAEEPVVEASPAETAAALTPEPMQKSPVKKTNQTENILFQWTPLSEQQKKLRGGINFDAGSDTLLDSTYVSLALRPHFSINRFSMEFYLPVQFSTNLLAGYDAFVLPNGNMEWSFGSDYNWQTETESAVIDAFDDLFNKIHYLRFATPADPFFLYMGHVENITMGYGLLVSNFDNSPTYPSIRRMGLFSSADISYWGIELLVDNVVSYQSMYIARNFIRPMARKYRLELGITVGVDFGVSKLQYAGEPQAGDPLQGQTSQLVDLDWLKSAQDARFGYFILGADLKLPLINPRSPLTPLSFVAETSFLMPFQDGGVNLITNQSLFQGWPDIAAVMAGFSGEIAGKSWFSMYYQIDVRYHGFLFADRLINANYTTTGRLEYGKLWGAILDSPSLLESNDTVLGISASLDMMFFSMFSLDMLLWVPMDLSTSQPLALGVNDRLEVGFSIEPENFFISFGARFQRRNFLAYFLKPDGYSSTSFLDADTTISGILSLTFGATKLSFIGSTALETNNTGAISLDDAGLPIQGGSFSVKISFGI